MITPTEELGYSNIFLDFISNKEQSSKFYPSSSIQKTALDINKINYDREAVAQILIKQNRLFNASEKTFENIEKFKDENSLAVFTGQQAGFLGGPLLIIIKAIAIVKAARLYEQELKQPVVPIFWIAGDDHDYEEVNHIYLLDRQSEVQKVIYDTVPQFELPTAELEFSDKEKLDEALAQLKDILGESDFTPQLYSLLEECYTESDNYVSAFGKLMAALLKNTGLIFFSPGDIEAKKIAVPFFKAIIENQDEIHNRLNNNNQSILDLGYHIQVEKKDNSVHLFYNNKGRRPLLLEDRNFVAGDESFTKEELLRLIETHPERFSSDVMTRPVLQSYFFPTLSQKGGAAEIAYLAQIHNLFELFSLKTPYYKARPTATVIEKRFEKLMDEQNISFEDLTSDIEQVINRIMSETFPDNLEHRFNDLRDKIKDAFESFTKESLKFDPSLESFAQQTMGKIDYSVKAFEGKVFSSHKRKDKEGRDKIYRLWHSLYPNRNFQERSLNIAYFISKYGFEFIDFLYEKIEPENENHRLICLSEMNK